MATKVSDAVPAAKKKRPAGSAPAGAGDALKLKALVDQVTATTGGKKKDVRAAVSATLQALGAALSAGQELNLPPLGKAKVSRKIDTIKGVFWLSVCVETRAMPTTKKMCQRGLQRLGSEVKHPCIGRLAQR